MASDDTAMIMRNYFREGDAAEDEEEGEERRVI